MEPKKNAREGDAGWSASDRCTATETQEPTRKHRRDSIRLRLASLVVACVLPVWIAAGFLVYYNYQSRRALTEQSMLETARALTMVVDRELSNMQATLGAFAASPSLVSGDLRAFYNQARATMETRPGANIILSDVTAQELVHTFLPFGVSLPKRAVPQTIRRVYATGKPVITGIYTGAGTRQLQIAVDVPVFRSGRVAYDLAMVASANRLAAILLQQHLPSEWLAGIMDNNQVIVARTRLAEQFVGQPVNTALAQRMRATEEGVTESTNLEGIPMFNGFSRSAQSGWTVSIGVPKAIITADIWRGLWWALACAALLSLAGILMALMMARRISGSIHGLIAPALALGRGEPVIVEHLELAETDEVGESLTRASQLIQQRAEERARAEAARRESQELKRLNAELEQSEAEARARAAELAAIMDAVPAIIHIAHDPECKRITSNRAGYELLRLPPGSNVSKSAPESERALNYHLMRDGREVPLDELPLQMAATGREIRNSGFTIAFDDGASRTVFGNAVPLLDGAGKVVGAVGALIDVTEREQAEKQLMRTAERLQAILDNAPVGIVINDREGGLIEPNAAYQRICGYSAEELKGKKFADFTYPDDIAQNLQLFEQLRSDKLRSYEIEKRYIRKDGEIIWVRAITSRLTEESNISIIQDITARKHAEQQLRATADRLKAIMEHAPVGIVTGSREYRFLETNAAFQKMTGYSGDELRHMDWKTLTHPDDIAPNVELVDKLFAGELEVYEYEKRYLPKNGKTIWVRIIGARVDSEVKMSIVEDITERKRVEAQLQATMERLQAIVQHAPVGVTLLDRKGRVQEANPALCHILGYSAEELKGRSFKEYTHPDDLQKSRFDKWDRQPYELEKRYIRKDGNLVWVRVVACPINHNFLISIVEDITARKREEEQRRGLEEQLRQAQKMEAVGHLAGGVAHDFNNLLMVIQSYAEMLQDRLPAQDRLRKNTQEILKAAARAAGLTRQLLAFSRKQILSPVVLDLNGVVDEAARMLERLIGEDIEFRMSPAESLWAIKADPDQIVQVLMNLCVNARDAMPQGGALTIATGNVTVEAGLERPYVAPGDYVMLSVTDTGIGISKEILGCIFDPFFTTKEVGKGTGLGLATVYGIVKQSGGYVWVDSELGQGACFTVYLPRAKGAIASTMSAKAKAQPRGTGTILVAEDEEALREAVCDYLRSLGYTVLRGQLRPRRARGVE